MFVNKKSGDDLALAFAKILNSRKNTIEKSASNCASSADDATDMVKDEAMDMGMGLESMVKDEAMDLESMVKDEAMDLESMAEDDIMDLENMAKDMLLDEEMDMVEDSSYDAYDMLDDAEMAKHSKLMKGLGKIAGSLRRKGEVFAADVVEATALSVRNDIVKEASAKKASQIKKASVLRELDAMATRLSNKGNLKAAKEVIKTARKIVKK